MSPDFETLPLAEQQRELQQALERGEPLEKLLEQCADLPDPTPLAWLSGRPGLMQENAGLFARKLVHWPETSLLKMLKSTIAPRQVLEQALAEVPLERLAVLAILDRQLKQHYPDAYEAYLEEIERQCQQEDPPQRALALVPSRAIPGLNRLRERRTELAHQAIEQLASVPKAVSLSHAEELLSRRVYTQPGHFMFELLQNAEDARASTFRVRFESDRIEVWHNGLPFDLRDLVGVTSIGQTTKRKNQIGFFGVGFKSVYEVTERPQIVSDVYAFEIVDVSIPRRIAHPGTPGTTLTLPLRKPFPELPGLLRSQLDPVLLLTLTNLKEIDLGEGHAIRRVGDRVGEQAFLLDESVQVTHEIAREAGRPDRTRLLVGVYLDEQNQPVPPPPGAPTVYSYLPTAEPTGLRFLIHGHFDLPVDRERIHPDSAWNQWVLSHVPAALARLAARADLLEVLPLPGETAGAYAFLPGALKSALAEVACLEGRRPRELALTSPEIAALELDPSHRAWEGRRREVAEKTLGVPLFGIEELLLSMPPPWQEDPRWDRLFALLAGRDVSRVRLLPGGRCPAEVCLGSPELRKLYPEARFAPAWLDGHRFLEEQGARRLTAADLVQDLEQGMPVADPDLALQILSEAAPEVRLRACRLPLFPCQDGQRYPLALVADDWSGAVQTSHQALAEHYRGKRPLLDRPMTAWRPVSLDFGVLVEDLNAGRLDEIPHELLEQGWQEVSERALRELGRRPLWRDRQGKQGSLAQVRRATHPELAELLPRHRMLHPELTDYEHVRALTPEPVGVDELVSRLDLPEALEFLLQHSDELTTAAVNRLLAAGRLTDHQGRVRPLSELCRADEALRKLYRGPLQRPFLDETSAGAHLLEKLGQLERVPRLKPGDLLLDLVGLTLEREHALEVLDWIDPRQLSAAEAAHCQELNLYYDTRGQSGTLREVLLFEERWQPLFEGQLRLLHPDFESGARKVVSQARGTREALEVYRHDPPQELLRADKLLLFLELFAVDPVPGGDFETLRVWPTRNQGRTNAREALIDEGVLELFPDRKKLEDRLLLPRAAELLPRLARPLDGREVVREEVFSRARPGQVLSEQPAFLNTPERVVRVASYLGPGPGTPLVDGTGCLRLERLTYCDPESLELLPWATRRQVTSLDLREQLGLSALPVEQVIGGLAQVPPREWLSDEDRRQRFYRLLLQREGEVFSTVQARQLLTEHPFWRTEKGSLLAADQLVLDDRLPDLGVDWRPHEEVPQELRAVLKRQLGVGLPDLEELVGVHVLPAYRKATSSGQKERALQLFDFLEETLKDRPPAEVRSLLGRDFPLEDRHGRYRPAHQVVRSDSELEEALEQVFEAGDYLLATRYGPDLVRHLELAEIPPVSQLTAVFSRPRRNETARGLARLASVMVRRHGPGWLDQVSNFKHDPWLPDGLGAPRRPFELYLPDAEVEALIGDHPRHYPDRALAALLGDELMGLLGLRTSVELEAVLANLDQQRAVSFRVYQWLEARLVQGQVGPEELRRKLANKRWVYTDDGQWYAPSRVLGTHAFALFGERRGYWERGYANCPELCRAFSIPGEISPQVVREFLQEVAGGPPDQLRKERPLARMLLACYRRLSDLGPNPVDPALAVILAEQRPGGERVLLAADHKALFSSDTPTLERLFEKAGKLSVAWTGPVEGREEVEAFHAAMGLRSLREAFTVELGAGGQDVTGQCAAGITRLRTALRSLVGVLERVRRQRTQLSPDHWVDQQRLRPVAQSGRIRAIAGLKVTYRLEGVGTVPVQARGAYHPDERELLVDASLAERPDSPLTGLAQGLLPCVYQGPGEEQLVDILEILLPLVSREAMDAYLDERHFPRGQDEPVDRVSERISEVLDFGLERRLAARFPELDPACWQELPPGLTVEQAVERLLAGVEEPSKEVRQALTDVLTAPSLDHIKAPPVPLESPPPPVPMMVARETAPTAQEQPGEPSLWNRLVGWFSELTNPSELPPAAEQAVARLASVLPAWATGGNPFAPVTGLGTQFWGTRARLAELAARACPVGLEYQPHGVPRPYLYALHCLAGSFDPGSQRWLPADPVCLAGLAEGEPTGRTISFSGRLEAGVNRLPLPFFTRAVPFAGAERAVGYELRVRLRTSGVFRYQVEVLDPPRLTGGVPEAPPAWLRPTLAVGELPAKAREWLESVRKLSPWEKALAAEEMVQQNYAYDRDYLERPEARQRLASLTPGQGNHHLAVLHARRGGGKLGHGICYELNVMLVELLRHAGVPALVGSGWALDLGRVDRPDHLFAVALLESTRGPVLMPLDGIMSASGGPLRAQARALPGEPTGPSLPRPGGAWGGAASVRPVEQNVREVEQALADQELARHLEAVRLMLRDPGFKLPQGLPPEEAMHRLRETLRKGLGSPELVGALVRLVGGEYTQLQRLPPEVEELVRRGLAQVQQVPLLRVVPKR